MKATVHLYHDTRSQKKDGTFPVKLAVYDPWSKTKKLFRTDFNLTTEDFEKATEPRPRGNFKDLGIKLHNALAELQEIVDSTIPFTFVALSRSLGKSKSTTEDIMVLLKRKEHDLIAEGRIKTGLMYQSSYSAIKRLREKQGHRNVTKLLFREIDKEWLIEFEEFITETEHKSISTVGSYLRNVRTIFNEVAKSNPGLVAHYPFRKGVYTIPSSRKVNRALNKAQIGQLYNHTPESPGEELAKDFWFASYVGNGMNLKDILLLKQRNIRDGRLIFIRQKTKNTKRENQRPVVVPLSNYLLNFIAKYKHEEVNQNQYLLSFLQDGMDDKQIYDRLHVLNRRIRKNLRKIALKTGLPSNFSQQWARHSYCGQSLQAGVNPEILMFSLGHSSFDTTKAYLGSFEDEQMKATVEQLMNFDIKAKG